MMERSAPLPMRIDMSIGADMKDGLEYLTAAELLLRITTSRIRTLRLSGYPVGILTVLYCLRSPSPLESLSLWVIVHSEQPVDVNLPKALFGRKAPHFRYLRFENSFACIRAPRRLLAGITHFTTSASTGLYELLRALRAMPRLEVLRIEHICHVWDDTDPPERVSLPRLSLLSFHDTTPRRLVILSSRIDAPPALRKQLFWSRCAIRSWNRLANMFTAVPALVPPDSAPGIDDGGLRVAHVTGGLERGSFDVWSRTGSNSASASSREDALFLFNVGWSYSFIDPRLNDPSARPSTFSFFFLARLCGHLRTARIEDLTIAPETAINSAFDSWHEANAEQWKALLTALPSVKTLRLHGGNPACVSVLRALSAFADPLLPHLQRVFVLHFTVHCAAAARPDSVDAAGAGSAVASREVNVGAELVQAVSGRSGLEVVLIGCEVDDEALEALRKRARIVIEDERVCV